MAGAGVPPARVGVEFAGLDGVTGRAEGQPPPSPGVPVAVPPARRRSPACRPHVSPGTEPDRHCRSCDPREPPGALLRRLWPLLSAPKLTQADTAQRSRRWIAHYSSQPSPLRSGPAEDGTRLLRDSSGVPRRSSASTAQGTSSGGGRTATKHQRTEPGLAPTIIEHLRANGSLTTVTLLSPVKACRCPRRPFGAQRGESDSGLGQLPAQSSLVLRFRPRTSRSAR